MEDKSQPQEINEQPSDEPTNGTAALDGLMKFLQALLLFSLGFGAIWSLIFFGQYKFFPDFEPTTLAGYLLAVTFWGVLSLCVLALVFALPGVIAIKDFKKFNNVSEKRCYLLSVCVFPLFIAYSFFIAISFKYTIVSQYSFLLLALAIFLAMLPAFVRSSGNEGHWASARSTEIANALLAFMYGNIACFVSILMITDNPLIKEAEEIHVLLEILFLIFSFQILLNIAIILKGDFEFYRPTSNKSLNHFVNFLLGISLFLFLSVFQLGSSFVLNFPFHKLGIGGNIPVVFTLKGDFVAEAKLQENGLKPLPLQGQENQYYFTLLVGVGKEYLVEYSGKDYQRHLTIPRDRIINKTVVAENWIYPEESEWETYQKELLANNIKAGKREDYRFLLLHEDETMKIYQWENPERKQYGTIKLGKKQDE